MSLFSSAKAKLAASKLAEEQLYAHAAEEVASGQIRQGLWAKAIAEADGDETAAKGRYLKLRVEMMKAEADLLDHAEKELVREFDLAEEREKREREAQANKNNKQAARRDRETLAEMKRQAKESYLEDEPGIKKDFIILVLVLSCIAIGLTVLVNAAT